MLLESHRPGVTTQKFTRKSNDGQAKLLSSLLAANKTPGWILQNKSFALVRSFEAVIFVGERHSPVPPQDQLV